MEDTPLKNGEFALLSVGDRLREARKLDGKTLEDVAKKTRVPMRHLQALEEGRYDDMPGRTYAIGFAKAYGQAVDLDEASFIDDMRAEMASFGMDSSHSGDAQNDDFEDPAKVPTAKTAWIIAVAGIALLIGGYGIWRTMYFPAAPNDTNSAVAQSGADNSDNGTASAQDDSAVVERQDDGTLTAPASGEVVFTATQDNVWVKFYDGSGKQLMQKQMALGERYIVPADADNPQIWTGRPDAFSITIGNTAMPPLGTSERTIRDVPVSASALLARKQNSERTDRDERDSG